MYKKFNKFLKNIYPYSYLSKKIIKRLEKKNATREQINNLTDIILDQQFKTLRTSHTNPINKFGKKCFSQTDEDGITLEILKRINNIENGIFIELGVGDGSETNTLVLASLGWSGIWIDSKDLKVDTAKSKKFTFLKEWIDLDNVTSLIHKGLNKINKTDQNIDVISIDLDGNDIYFVEKILKENLKPKLFIVEYNGKFFPPLKFQIDYNPQHIWQGTDYFGASLKSFWDLFSKYGYRLVCCNLATGSNAFFIDNTFSKNFSDVPTEIDKIYIEPRYYTIKKYAHKPDIRTINKILKD